MSQAWTCPRSVLFVPADKPDIAKKAIASAADTVCFDLEDGVAPANKAMARNCLNDLTQQANQANKTVWVRVNADLLELARDIEALVLPIENIVLSKTRGWSQLSLVDEALAAKSMGTENVPGIVALLEDVTSIQHFLNSQEGGSVALSALALGTEDLSGDLGIKPNTTLLNMALYDVVKLAKRLKVPVLGFPGSIANFTDLDLLAKDIATARQLGAKGAFCIHPRQVGVLNSGYSPSEDEVAWARVVLSVAQQIEANGVAVHPITKQMLDRPVLHQAQEILLRV